MLTVFGGSIPGGLKLQLGYVLILGLLTWGLNLNGSIMALWFLFNSIFVHLPFDLRGISIWSFISFVEDDFFQKGKPRKMIRFSAAEVLN